MTAIGDKSALDLTRCLVGDLRQFASVRRIVLDDGPEKGVAALAFSTGGGLDFWVLLDRAMDIGPLWHKGSPVAWQSPAGFRHPALIDVDSEAGYGFERGFSGFLMTCGLDHSRWPIGEHPHHGRLAFLPARLLACGENWETAEPHLFCEGEIVQWRRGAEALRLVRRIEAPIGGQTLRIRDRVENFGRQTQRHALLYHFNFGYPCITPGSAVTLDGEQMFGPLGQPDDKAQAVSVSRPAKSPTGRCTLHTGVDAVLSLAFSAESLPHLQVWHDPRPHAFVLALEPCTSAKPALGTLAIEPILEPGEQRIYALDLSFGRAP